MEVRARVVIFLLSLLHTSSPCPLPFPLSLRPFFSLTYTHFTSFSLSLSLFYSLMSHDVSYSLVLRAALFPSLFCPPFRTFVSPCKGGGRARATTVGRFPHKRPLVYLQRSPSLFSFFLFPTKARANGFSSTERGRVENDLDDNFISSYCRHVSAIRLSAIRVSRTSLPAPGSSHVRRKSVLISGDARDRTVRYVSR